MLISIFKILLIPLAISVFFIVKKGIKDHKKETDDNFINRQW